MAPNKITIAKKIKCFGNSADVDRWYSRWRKQRGVFSFPKAEDVFEAGKRKIMNYTECAAKSILEEYHITQSVIVDYSCSFGVDSIDALKSAGIGAGAGLGLGLILGVSFVPVIAVTTLIGLGINRYKRIEDAKDSLLNVSKEYAQAYAERIYEILQVAHYSKELSYPPKTFSSAQEETKQLTAAQKQIKDFLDSRDIKYLVHFTSGDNINSIKKYGLLSVEELRKRGINYSSNDENRLDGKLDYISLSVSTFNKRLLRSYISTGRIHDVKAIYISASLLYEEIDTDRIYCDRNAAASSCKKGSTLRDFGNMFAYELSYTTTSSGEQIYNRESCDRKTYEPTDNQAEILFRYNVPAKYIVGIKDLGRGGYYGY